MSHVDVPFSRVPVTVVPQFADSFSISPIRIEWVGLGEENVILSGSRSRYKHSDVIRISVGNSSRELVGSVFLKIIVRGHGFSPPEFCVKGCGCYSRDIPANYARLFFSALIEEQKVRVCSILPIDFRKTVQSLVGGGYITAEESQFFSKNVHTGCTRYEFESEIEKNLDERGAISLATHYAKMGYWMLSIQWLVKANNFLLKKKPSLGATLGDFVDLKQFWSHIRKISSIGGDVFNPGVEELADQAAMCSCIKEIDLLRFPQELSGRLEGIGRFLRRSPFVERLSITAPSRTLVIKENFIPIIEALRVNSSLKVLRVVNYSIGDEGVKGIVEALSSSSYTSIEELELNIPNMTEDGERSLLKLLKKKPDLRLNLPSHLGVFS